MSRKSKFLIALFAIMLCPLFFGYYQDVPVKYATTTLTASDDTYLPNETGWRVGSMEYMSYELQIDETAGDSPGVTVSIEVSNSGTNWGTYSQTVCYPIDGAASGTLSIADENWDFGSIHPMPCKFVRFKFTEGNGDDDDTAYLYFLTQ